MATLEDQLRAQGGEWDIGGVDRAGELADLLRKQGINSLGALSLTGDYDQQKINANLRPMSRSGNDEATEETLAAGDAARSAANTRRLKIGDKEVGFLGDYNLDGTYGSKAQGTLQDGTRLGWSARGDGNVAYNVVTKPDGSVAIVPTWGSSSDKDRIGRALAGLAVFTGAGLAANAGMFGAGVGAASGAGGSAAAGIGATEAAAALGGAGEAAGAAGAASGAGAAGGGMISAGEFGALTGAAADSAAAGLVGVEGALTAAPGAGLFGAGTAGAAGGGVLESLSSVTDWLGNNPVVQAGSKLFNNSTLMNLIGAGVSQYSTEKATDEQREWIEKQLSDKRKRQKPVKTPGMLFTAQRRTNG